MIEPINLRLIIEAVIVTAVMIAAGVAEAHAYMVARRKSPAEVARIEAQTDERLNRYRQMQKEQQAEIDELRRDLTEAREKLEILREEMTADHEEMAEMRVEMTEWRAGMRLVFQQMQIAGITPAWQPRERPPRENPRRRGNKPPGSLNEEVLPIILASLFNIEELDLLAVDVGARPEDLIGQTIDRRAASLVLWARRHSRLDLLVAKTKQLRPDGGL